MLHNSTMRRRWKFWALCLAAASIVTVWADSSKSVTAAQVNGTWKTKYAEFKIWALGQQRLQIEFSGVYEYKTPQGPSANRAVGNAINFIITAQQAIRESELSLAHRVVWIELGRPEKMTQRFVPAIEPPFNAGSPDTAPAEVLALMKKRGASAQARRSEMMDRAAQKLAL